MQNPFHINTENDNVVFINPSWMVHFANKWEYLTKYQKAFISRLLFSTRVGNLSEVADFCNCKTNKKKFNDSIKLLVDFKIVICSDYKKDDLIEVPMEFHPTKISKSTKTWKLADDWYMRLIMSNIENQSKDKNRLNY